MNRKWFWLLGIGYVLLVFGACASYTPIIFDENLPLEESTHMFFYPGIHLKEYNGITIPHKKSIFGVTSSSWHEVYLPPGEMEFNLDIWEKIGNWIITADDVRFRYKFDAGRYYILTYTTSGGSDKDTWGINIYDGPLPKIGYPKKENLIAFTPFYTHGN